MRVKQLQLFFFQMHLQIFEILFHFRKNNCNFVSLMKAEKSYQNKKAKVFASTLLAVLFLAIPFIQMLHSHHASEDFVNTVTEKSISITAEKCLICDYTAEIKGKQILMAQPPVVNIPTNICATLNTFVYTRIYKFTLQNFSNKGPPSRLS